MAQPIQDKITVKSRSRARLSPKLEKNLIAYAAAATAAGVGVLVSPPVAEGKIVYTPKHAQLHIDKPYPIDLNHDGKVDFFLLQKAALVSNTGLFGGVYLAACHRPVINSTKGYLCTSSTGATNALNEVRVVASGRAAALPAGASIRNGERFGGKDVRVNMGSVDFKNSTNTLSTWGGPWMNGGKGVENRYLGLEFQINGKFHFGWARLTVTTQKRDFTATLTGYAYETIPGKAIIAGKTSGPDEDGAIGSVAPVTSAPVPATLGTLAKGERGLSLWRRE